MSSSDEDVDTFDDIDVRTGRRRGRNQTTSRVMCRPMVFVSGTHIEGTRKTETIDNKHNENQFDAVSESSTEINSRCDVDADEDESITRNNESFRAGLGFGIAARKPSPRQQSKAPSSSSSSSSSSTRQPLMSSSSSRYQSHRVSSAIKPSFEKHTRGFGSKYLAQFGFTGRLGRNQTGLAAPIQATVRATGTGIGFGIESGQDARIQQNQKKEKKNRKKASIPRPAWRIDRSKKASAVEYRTAEDVAANITIDDSIIYDYSRGAGARVVSTSSISAASAMQDSEDDEEQGPTLLPELVHNVQLLVDLSEANIQKLGRRKRILLQEVSTVKTTRADLQCRMTSEIDAVNRLQNIMNIVNEMMERLKPSHDNRISLEELADIFQELQHTHAGEYREYHLEMLSIDLVFPEIQQMMQSWQPLQEAKLGLETFRRWRVILSSATFERLCEHTLMPTLRRTLSTSWCVNDSESTLILMESWKQVLPMDLLHELRDAVIVPKLARHASTCNPLDDMIPAHVWCHPWLPLLGKNALQSVHDALLERFTQSLLKWNTSDVCALHLLTPWKNVFHRRAWRSVLSRGVVPKLNAALNLMPIHLRQRVVNCCALTHTLQWKSFIGESTILDMLEASVWHRWLHGLHNWLATGADFAIVSAWYLSWKQQLDDSIVASLRVRCVLSCGLRLINRAISGQSGTNELRQGLQQMNSMRLLKDKEIIPEVTPSVDMSADLSLRDLVSKLAELNDFEFKPNIRRGRYHGKQIFWFGRVNIYLDNQLIFHLISNMNAEQDKWTPIGLEELTTLARQRAVL